MSKSRSKFHSAKKTTSPPQTSTMDSTSATHQSMINIDSESIFEFINTKFEEMKTVMLNKIETELQEIKNFTNFINDKYDDILQKLQQIMDIPNTVNKIKEEIADKEIRLSTVEIHLADIEQAALLNSIEINGIKLQDNISPVQAVTRIAELAGVTMSPEDTYKVTTNKTNDQTKITINFKDTTKAQTMLASKHSDPIKKFNGEGAKYVYLNAALTQYYKNLHWNTRKRAQEKDYKYVWVKSGKILVRKSKDSKVMEIKHLNDISNKLT